MYAIADVGSALNGIVFADGIKPDSCDDLASDGCVPDDVRADAYCVDDGMIMIAPICFDGTETKSAGDEITNVR